MDSHVGEYAALATAVCWSATALAFEAAGKRVGSLPVNWIRLCFGLVFLSIFTKITRGMALPLDASGHAWFWLSLSGLIGFAIGDLCLFRAFVVIGARMSMLIMATVPPLTALIGWWMMGETLTTMNYIGMSLTLSGIVIVVLEREPGQSQFTLSRPLSGILIAFGGALGQAVGLVMSKYGMGDYDAFAATQIRIIAGIAGFFVIFIFLNAWRRVGAAFTDGRAMANTTVGAIFGPFLGVGLSLLAIKYTTTGVASTIMAIVPVLIIPPAILLFREKVTFKEVVGALIAVSGVAVLFQ
jgi:drug/metabolite transporter (DMT)-like permease